MSLVTSHSFCRTLSLSLFLLSSANKEFLMRMTSPGRFTGFLIGEDQVTLDALNSILWAAGYVTRTYTALQTFLDGYDQAAHGCTLLDLSMQALDKFDVQQDLGRVDIHRL